ncbi:MAG: ImmA/IrrE family metallo-endopeptidase [Candidatus Fusobacterium pullicola]|uniref:ImmA/IrrE family metallo-endopeptidase n=1 Tax=Candidatus Fusobacterium pullicola TaxID=2838601 RepID=A0A9E2KYK4_9FUSO|nr:ImmA/IrrE family metallo-endopeptidase [Candidatus Fusobacterium pullicola]
MANNKNIEKLTTLIRDVLSIKDFTTLEDWQNSILRLGGELRVDPNFPDDAYITKMSDDQNPYFSITISPYHTFERINFSLAHELGHLFLHMSYLVNDEAWREIEVGKSYTRLGSDLLEFQANEFAANLLMPKEEFLKLAMENRNENNFYNIEPLLERFRVSRQAIINRGRWLGIFPW